VVVQQLQRGRALAGDHIGVVKRGDEGAAFALGQGFGDGHGVFGVAVIAHHLGARAQGGGQLGRRRIVGHDDGGRDAQYLRGQGHRLGVVTRRISHHPRALLGGRELRQGVVATAKLESAHALEVFALEKNLRPQLLVQACRAQHGGAVRVAVQALRGSAHVLECGQSQRCHPLTHPGFNAK